MRLLVTLSIVCLITACEKPQVVGKGWKEEWHPACKVASAFVPMHFKERIRYSEQRESKQYNHIGDCRAEKVTGEIWFVRGIWLTAAMKLDGIPAIDYEAVMFEDNDPNDLAVQRYGTQYVICSVAIKGEDRTGSIRLNRCGDGKYIHDFKRRHHL